MQKKSKACALLLLPFCHGDFIPAGKKILRFLLTRQVGITLQDTQRQWEWPAALWGLMMRGRIHFNSLWAVCCTVNEEQNFDAEFLGLFMNKLLYTVSLHSNCHRISHPAKSALILQLGSLVWSLYWGKNELYCFLFFFYLLLLYPKKSYMPYFLETWK